MRSRNDARRSRLQSLVSDFCLRPPSRSREQLPPLGMASNVLRELLPCPLPFPNAGGPAPASSRSVQRRHHRKTHWQAWCNEGVATLNEMYGHGTIDDSAVEATPSAAQSSCLARLTAAYCHMGRPPDDYASAAGAFSELCSAPAGYSDATPAAGKPVPYQSGRVSIPSAGNAPADPSQLMGVRIF